MKTIDGGPWKGPTLEEWLKRISPWPTPWYRREPIFRQEVLDQLAEMGILFVSESELRYLAGDR